MQRMRKKLIVGKYIVSTNSDFVGIMLLSLPLCSHNSILDAKSNFSCNSINNLPGTVGCLCLFDVLLLISSPGHVFLQNHRSFLYSSYLLAVFGNYSGGRTQKREIWRKFSLSKSDACQHSALLLQIL